MTTAGKITAYFSVFLLALAAVFYVIYNSGQIGQPDSEDKTASSSAAEKNKEGGAAAQDGKAAAVATDLEVPWEMVFLPDGDWLVTERPGTLRRLGSRAQELPIEGVAAVGEGGLLGLALDPDFTENGNIYLYQTARDDGRLINRVVRYYYDGNRLSDRQVILDNLPAGSNHNGGRIAFGPDGYLYVTTGDAGNSRLAQDRDSLAGKILRLSREGGVPEGNPFGSLVWSYGHRNPQGLAWDETGRLWSVEHGRSGAASGFDEINLIEPGKNYGWPDDQGSLSREGRQAPAQQSGESVTWAPAALVYLDGQLIFSGLRGTAIYRSRIEGEKASEPQAYLNEYGRWRLLKVGPDGYLYAGTSNRDGRGQPRAGDDRIIRIDLRLIGIDSAGRQ